MNQIFRMGRHQKSTKSDKMGGSPQMRPSKVQTLTFKAEQTKF